MKSIKMTRRRSRFDD